MNIGISLLQFFPGQVGGAGEYIERLIPALVDEMRPEDRLTLIGSPANLSSFETLLDARVHRHQLNWSRRSIQLLRLADLLLPGSMSRLFVKSINLCELDVILFPQQSVFPRGILAPQVVTIVDFLHERCPQFVSVAQRWLRRLKERHLFRTCAATISISRATESDLLRLHRFPKEQSFVVYLAGKSSEAPAATNPVPDGPPYFYYPAAAFPHKNHASLIEAFLRFQTEFPVQAARLVLTGQASTRLRKLVAEAGPSVLHLGFVSRAEVAAIYRGCTAVVIPSLFEGFGMPVIEGLGYGKPVYCSDLDVFREIAGDLVNYFDSTSEAAFIEVFHTALQGRPRQVDSDRVSKLLESFSWKRCATETYAVLASRARKHDTPTHRS